jgi:hypothetical protein
MIRINVQALTQSIFDRIATDTYAPCVDLRSRLGIDGTGSDPSVIHARLLRANARPRRPFLAFRAGPIVTRERVIAAPLFYWMIYDDLVQSYERINTLLPLIDMCYDAAKIQLADTVVGEISIDSGSREQEDPQLNLLMRYVTVSVDATW